MSTSTDKVAKYRALVQARKACKECARLINPSKCADGIYDSDHIGPWSRWQGQLDATVMVIGQDWADVGTFERWQGRDDIEGPSNPTNTMLLRLLRSAGVDCAPGGEGGRGPVFLTNAILCLKPITGGMQGPVDPAWFANCAGRFLRPTIELVRPRVAVTLGDQAYRAVCSAYGLTPKPLAHAVAQQEPVPLASDIGLLPMYHCGTRVLNTHRPVAAQEEDWLRLKRALLGR